jgi:hypothetical protein
LLLLLLLLLLCVGIERGLLCEECTCWLDSKGREIPMLSRMVEAR